MPQGLLRVLNPFPPLKNDSNTTAFWFFCYLLNRIMARKLPSELICGVGRQCLLKLFIFDNSEQNGYKLQWVVVPCVNVIIFRSACLNLKKHYNFPEEISHYNCIVIMGEIARAKFWTQYFFWLIYHKAYFLVKFVQACMWYQ